MMVIKPLFKTRSIPAPIPTFKRVLVSLVVPLLLVSCAQNQQPLAVETAIDEAAKSQSAERTQVPSAVTQALLPGSRQVRVSEKPEKEEERFSLSVNDVPAKSFFLGLVEGTGVNIVVHPEVSGDISLELNDVTVEDVLAVSRDIYGYEYKVSRGIYTIYPSKLRTEIFHINYLDVQRSGTSNTRVNVGNEGMGDSNSNSSSGSSSTSSSSSGSLPGSSVQTLNETDFWGSLQETITAIVGGEQDDRMVMITPQAGMVVVKALPNELASVRDFLERSELSVKRQVILEAKILEVRLSSGFESGINWSAISGQLMLANNVSEFSSPAEINSASESVGEIFASMLKINDISQLLSLLETQGNVQVLSSPRISTVNNQKAVIRVGSDEFFVTGVSSGSNNSSNNNNSGDSGNSGSSSVEISSFFSGIALDVTPQIAAEGDVVLHIHPVISEVRDQQKSFTVDDKSFSLPLALRDIRESDSIVRAKNGQVVVLGGLMQESSIESKGKRPILGDVPLVNSLFKTKNKTTVKTELVILLRPIVVADSTWKSNVSESQENIHRLGNEYRKIFGGS